MYVITEGINQSMFNVNSVVRTQLGHYIE